MGFKITDGSGKSFSAKVTPELQLITQAEVHELQHHISRHRHQVYQIVGKVTGDLTSENTVLHIRNTSSTLHAVVSYMRVQAVSLSGGTSVPSSASYFSLGTDTDYSSSGILTTPSNMFFASANIADLLSYNESPIVTGTFNEFDFWHNDNSMMTFNKHGSLIMGKNDTFEIRFTTDHTKGLLYARITMMMLDLSGD